MSEVILAKEQVVTFPAVEIEQCLRNELAQAAEDKAVIYGRSDSAGGEARRRGPSFQHEIDSLVVIEILCAIEEVVGFEIPDSIVCAGGYGMPDQLVTDLMPKIESLWHKRSKRVRK